MVKVAMLSKWHVHAGGYAGMLKNSGKAEIVAVWDDDQARGEAWAKELGAEFIADLDTLLARDDIEAVICDAPNGKKYDAIAFPEGDTWGLIFPSKDPLAQRETICVDDLVGLPLFTSEHGWEGDIRKWAGDRFPELHLEGSFRLAYNASMFVREGLGYQLSFRHLVDISESSGLTFRPLEPRLESKLYLIWNRYQAFTPIAERFIEQIRRSFV
jgi:DNA-binding transcriptional LysR family regulator